MVAAVARSIHIPFAVGGGINSRDDMARVLAAGAEKISLNSMAVLKPDLIAEGARDFGSQCIVLGMDPVKMPGDKRFPSGYEITIRGFRERTGLDALAWARRAQDLGAGEIVVNSVDADGTRQGFELTLTRMIATQVRIPVVASGGAGTPDHLAEVFTAGCADAAIIAGMIHTGDYTIRQIKEALLVKNIPVRKKW